MTKWVDEHPSRFDNAEAGDFIVMNFGFQTHFVRIMSTAGGTFPAFRAACGEATPDWRDDPNKYPMAGIVNCAGCLEAMEEDKRRSRDGSS